jgi:hypothetical protein
MNNTLEELIGLPYVDAEPQDLDTIIIIKQDGSAYKVPYNKFKTVIIAGTSGGGGSGGGGGNASASPFAALTGASSITVDCTSIFQTNKTLNYNSNFAPLFTNFTSGSEANIVLTTTANSTITFEAGTTSSVWCSYYWHFGYINRGIIYIGILFIN